MRPGPSSPYNPQSNGLAEAAVKAVKSLVTKSAPDGNLASEAFLQGLLEYRNTPRESGLSPAEIVFGHPIRSIIPAHRSTFAPRWTNEMIERDHHAAAQAKAKKYYDVGTHPLAPLTIGTECRVQNPISKKWDRVGVVISIGQHRSYRIKFPSGNVLWRNRKFLRPVRPGTAPANKPKAAIPRDHTKKPRDDDKREQPIRRSTRFRKLPARYKN